MKTKELGRTGIAVSEICLGTMTWGSQNSEAEAHAQMDHALEHGVTFWDTAELYPTTPGRRETYGRTEDFIGTWFAARGGRERVQLATKIAGEGASTVPGSGPISAARITEAVEGSLRRLQTDYIDLYQLHWPNRGHYHFRRQWTYNPSTQPRGMADEVAEILGALGDCVAAGKIRAIGLSNETAWGTAEFLRIAAAEGLPRVATIQNEYSLLYRTFDLDLAELAHHEDVGLLAYSPLAAGILTGKYTGGALPDGSRGAINPEMGRRRTDRAIAAADAYAALARAHGLDPATMAIAFCLTRPFMTAPIVGGTTLAHLDAAYHAIETPLSDAVMAGIDEIRRAWPAPF
ncbi:MAG: aldo/keto reductase [Pseudomonadota bacterium]